MGREKRAAQNRAQEQMDKSGRSSDPVAAPTAAYIPTPMDRPHTSTGKAIVQIVCLYLVPILIIVAVGKFVLKL
jgi:hypothetical protein